MMSDTKANDVAGHDLKVGDTITSLSGDVTGRISDICMDLETTFVRVRPMHMSSGRGIWHASDQVLWLSRPKQKAVASTPVTSKKP